MHPILFKVGPFTVTTWGVFVLTGILLAVYYAAREAEKAGFRRDDLYDLAFFSVLAGIVGARLFYVLTHWSEFAADPVEILRIWHGGMVFYGGFLLGVPAALAFVYRRKLPPSRVADWIAPGIPLAIAIGRWGCFFNGCCFGKPTELPWGVIFPDGAAGAQFPGVHLHPTQIYESIGQVLVFLFLLYLKRQRHLAPGTLFWTMAFLSPLVRFFDDFFRYYEPSQYLFGGLLTLSQGISLAISLVALLALFRLWGGKTS